MQTFSYKIVILPQLVGAEGSDMATSEKSWKIIEILLSFDIA